MSETLALQGVRDLDLAQTFDCGQCFRWEQQPDGSFTGVVFGVSAAVRLCDGILYIETENKPDEALWRSYFDLDRDYAAVRGKLSALHPVLAQAASYAAGIRILRQEPFEALCTFIISQNNNIKRIKGIVKRLCVCFGKRLPDGAHAFPTPGVMAALTPEDLAPLRAGFRARYLCDAAKKVAGGEVDFSVCRTAAYEAARAELMKITGVGVKVADCTLLFGLHRTEAFPVDVWMKRAMERLFPDLQPSDFGDCAGIAQQYIFHFSRQHPALFV